MSDNIVQINRRDMLAASLGLATIVMGGTRIPSANATPDEMQAAISKFTGGAELKPGRVTLTMPNVAENGATVPFSVTVDSPMSEQDYVKAVYVLADNNPAPEVSAFHLTPDCGVAELSGRLRLARTQNVYAVAQMSDGSCYFAKTNVAVTVGGCGADDS